MCIINKYLTNTLNQKMRYGPYIPHFESILIQSWANLSSSGNTRNHPLKKFKNPWLILISKMISFSNQTTFENVRAMYYSFQKDLSNSI